MYAGKKNVEKSPAADLERLFTLGICDPGGCLLAICLREEKEGSGIDAPKCLDDLVCRWGFMTRPIPVVVGPPGDVWDNHSDAMTCCPLTYRLASENDRAARRHGEPFHYEGQL